MDSLSNIILTGKTSTENALHIYDQLEPVDSSFMIGRWKGSEFRTGHRMDGLLEVCGWYGKLFVDNDTVHPLLFYTASKKEVYAVNPALIPLWFNFPKIRVLRTILTLAKPILQTKKPKARLRMMDHRGKSSATMIYNSKSINDHFRKIDENKVMGLMDLKGEPKPYFFILERDESPMKIQLFIATKNQRR